MGPDGGDRWPQLISRLHCIHQLCPVRKDVAFFDDNRFTNSTVRHSFSRGAAVPSRPALPGPAHRRSETRAQSPLFPLAPLFFLPRHVRRWLLLAFSSQSAKAFCDASTVVCISHGSVCETKEMNPQR